MADQLNSGGDKSESISTIKEEVKKRGDKEHIVTSTTGINKDKSPKEDEKPIVKSTGTGAEDDDIPADFFDDFSNKDFLAGLDVVDAWEDDESKSSVSKSTATKEKSKKPKKDKDPSPKDKLDKKRRSHSRERKRRRSADRKSRSRERRSRSRGKRSKTPERRDRDKDKRDRRDPNKTQRDIQRDKAKCAKDKEAKFISEKLRVVETGLVPPGMEMEFDLNHIDQPSKRQSRSPERTKRMISLSPSPPKRRRYDISPVRRRVSPRRSPRRSPPRFSRTARRSPSPFDRRRYDRRSPSPGGKRYSGRRDRETPTKKRANSFLEELDQKLSIRAEENKLREIQEKINGGPSMLGNYAPVQSVSTPMPVPNPMTLPYQQPVYDQSFFIGHQEMPTTSFPQHDYNMQQAQYANPYQVQTVPMYQQPVLRPPSMMDDQDIQKLFNDDTISLTKFLQITAQHPDKSKPLDIKDKIKVLTRCQESIKLMTEFAKPTGRFYFKKPTKVPEKPPENKFQSPLKKTPPVRFNFTSKATKATEDKVSNPISRLLMKLGINDEPVAQTMPPAPEITTSIRNVPMAARTSQTEPYKCEDCEKRLNIRTATASVQCQSSVSDFSCQVTEDDFLNTARSALKNVIKNQSFANYTPAQILQSLNARDDEEVFPAARRLAERSPDVAPRTGVSNNDSFPVRAAMDDYDRERFERRDFERRNAQFEGGSSGFDPRFDSPRDIGVRDFGGVAGAATDRFREPNYPAGQSAANFRDPRAANANFREPAGNFRDAAFKSNPASNFARDPREQAATGMYGGRGGASVPNRPNNFGGDPGGPNSSNYGGPMPSARGNFAGPGSANYMGPGPAGANYPARPANAPGSGNFPRPQNPYGNTRY